MDHFSSSPLPPHFSFATLLKNWKDKAYGTALYKNLPYFALPAAQIICLEKPVNFQRTLLEFINTATQRILLPALYLQDDEAGRAVLAALYAAKARCPTLDIAVFVDWHRAQRGLIGKAKSAGNAALYQAMANLHGNGVAIYGVPIQRREFLGVMHLKGFVIDDKLLYSGASLNEVYLQWHERYRIDRYHVVQDRALADCLAQWLNTVLRKHPAVISLNAHSIPKTHEIRESITDLRRTLTKSHYAMQIETAASTLMPRQLKTGEVGVTPLFGLGLRHNVLNRTIVELIQSTKSELTLFTPYFNLPGSVCRALDKRLHAGCRVTIILGDKTANDFYIPPHEPFKTIGTLPYLYEANLRRFCQKRQRAINEGLLNIHLWRDGDNTFHLKGLWADEEYALLTGNNLNPRAWRLDLENGLLIHDPQRCLLQQHMSELHAIRAHTTRLAHFSELESLQSYPLPVQRLLRRLARVRADRLINQVL